MKFIDEKGRLFGKINLLDLLALLLVLAAVVFFGLRLVRGHDSGSRSVEPKHLTYTVLVEAVDPRSLPDVEKAIGEPLLSSGSLINNLVFTGYETEPCRVYATDEAGRIFVTEDDTRVNLVCTVEGTVEWAKHAPQIGSQEARVGKEHILKTETIEFTGTVLTMEVG
ncbi:MAG: DUF4330 domain-containing protein [Oscillospiraceae bacterium]|nr:DUF4330 domain-containing protein [Oscillospiraceae bacterium]